MYKVIRIIQIVVGMTLTMTLIMQMEGCISVNESTESGTYLEFTVVKQEELPQDLLEQINESRKECFKITYRDDEYLYIAMGYGKQKSGGYSVAVKEFYKLDNAIYFKTELVGPQDKESVSDKESYPYVVIKTELRENAVVFK